MQNQPKCRVSILLPLYNGVEFLKDSIPSILDQTFTAFSLWIGLNGFTVDEEIKVSSTISNLLKQLGVDEHDARIHICLLSKYTKGAPDTINVLTDLSGMVDQNDLVANIDADDVWELNKLEEQFKVIDRYPDLDIIGTRCKYFGDHTTEPPVPNGWISRKQLIFLNPLIHSSVISKRGLFKYNVSELTYDYDCWLRTYLIDKHTRFYNVPLILVRHRVHGHSFYNSTGKQTPESLVHKYLSLEQKP